MSIAPTAAVTAPPAPAPATAPSLVTTSISLPVDLAASAVAAVPTPTPTPRSSGPFTFSPNQHKFAAGILRTLKKSKDILPFLHPVDPVALNIPHYPNVVKHPMDFGTIDRKLSATKQKGTGGAEASGYRTAEEFVGDVRLVFENCYAFNGRQHAVSSMAERLQEMFERQTKQMPPPEEVDTLQTWLLCERTDTDFESPGCRCTTTTGGPRPRTPFANDPQSQIPSPTSVHRLHRDQTRPGVTQRQLATETRDPRAAPEGPPLRRRLVL